jgi:hypothetical protein
MARLPRPLWKKVLPDLTSRYHPTMSWLAVDGYGFDRAYFDTERWVDRQEIPASYPWQGSPEYFPRAVDQGIGRALWFISGGDPAKVSAARPKALPSCASPPVTTGQRPLSGRCSLSRPAPTPASFPSTRCWPTSN